MNIRIVRNKIKSVSNVKKITRAMQLVSAVKMKKAQELALSGKPYQEALERIMSKIKSRVDTQASKLLASRAPTSAGNLIILITSNKGLCGSFNSGLLRYLIGTNDIKNADFIIFGAKGGAFISRLNKAIIADFSSDKDFEAITAAVSLAVSEFLQGKYKAVMVYYNAFISSLRMEPQSQVLLPITLPQYGDLKEVGDYTIEPEPEEILDYLLKNYIEEKLRYILIQNQAGEHSARMIAMKNATDNANDLIYNMTLIRNKLRQQKITYELLDMMTAKESVEIN